jgi:glutaredoxin-like protein NrdH
MDTSNRLPIVVYAKPDCVQCDRTKKWLTAHKIRYREIDMEANPEALQLVKDMGYQAAPVVIVPFDWEANERHWYGFRPDLLATIK